MQPLPLLDVDTRKWKSSSGQLPSRYTPGSATIHADGNDRRCQTPVVAVSHDELSLQKSAGNLPARDEPDPCEGQSRSGRPLRTRPRTDLQDVPEHLQSPTSAASLYKTLIDLSVSRALPAHSFGKIRALVSYHKRYPGYNSARSYNLLISLATAKRDFDSADALMKDMDYAGIEGNLETRKLVVRYAIYKGRWTGALMREISRRSMTWPIWMEFFKSLESGNSLGQNPPKSRGTSSSAARYELLMRNLPSTDSKTTAQVPPRAMFYQIRWLIRNGRSDEALTTTKVYFTSLPKVMDDVMSRHCTDIMNLHLRAAKDQSRQSKIRRVQPLLRFLMGLNEALRPDSTTLFLYLSCFRYAASSCRRFVYILRRWEANWGENVIDDRILLWLTHLSMKAGWRAMMRYLIEKRKHREGSMKTPRLGRRYARQPHSTVFHGAESKQDLWELYEQRLKMLEDKGRRRHLGRRRASKPRT